MRKTREDILGFEHDWLAIDKEGLVALFSTAGGGYAPDAFLLDTESYEAAIEAILALPPRAAINDDRLASWWDKTWQRCANRGVFGFDASPIGGPYSRVTVPDTPIHVADLPAAVREVASRIVCSLSFRQLEEIDEHLIRFGKEELDEFLTRCRG